MDWLEPYIAEALALAEACIARAEVPVGALLVFEGNVIGRGANRREEKCRTVGHAEIEALEDYSQATGEWRVPPGTSLICTAEPCLMCTGALLWARVDNLYYGCEDPKQAGLRSQEALIASGRFDHKFKVVQGGLGGNAPATLMKRFFQMRRETAKN